MLKLPPCTIFVLASAVYNSLGNTFSVGFAVRAGARPGGTQRRLLFYVRRGVARSSTAALEGLFQVILRAVFRVILETFFETVFQAVPLARHPPGAA